MSDLQIRTRQVEGVVVLDLDGRIALGETSAHLHQTIRQLVDQGNKRIAINLGGVTGIDSSGLGSLVAAHTTVRSGGGNLVLANLPGRATELMTITKLYTVFDIFEDEEAAVRSFQQPDRITNPLDTPVSEQRAATEGSTR